MAHKKFVLYFIGVMVTASHAMNQLDAQLIEAVQTQKEEQILALLDQGANPNSCIQGLNALHAAAKIGRTPIIRMLIDRGAQVDAPAPGFLDATPLYFAVYNGYLDAVRELLAHKSDPNHRLREIKMTPLHIAAMKGKDTITSLLLDAGADPNAKTKDNCTPLHMVAEGGRYELIQFIRVIEKSQKPTRKSTVLIIPQNNLVETAKVLLERGALVNHAPIKGTPLHIAARHGQHELAQLFIQKGADIFACRPISATPFHELVVGAAVEIARNPKDIAKVLSLVQAFVVTPCKSVRREARVAVFPLACSLKFMHTQKAEPAGAKLPKDVHRILYEYCMVPFLVDRQLNCLKEALCMKMKFAAHEFTPSDLALVQSRNGDLEGLKRLTHLLDPNKVEQHRKMITVQLLNKIKL